MCQLIDALISFLLDQKVEVTFSVTKNKQASFSKNLQTNINEAPSGADGATAKMSSVMQKETFSSGIGAAI